MTSEKRKVKDKKMGLFSSVSKVANSVTGGMFNPVGEGGLFNKYHQSTSGQAQQDDINRKAMESWTLANDYNHPIQQMERLKAAGLNPNLVYGSGQVTGNTTGAPSLVGGMVSTKSESAIRGLNQILSFAQGKANIDQARAGAQASVASAGASSAQAANLNAQTAINETKATYEKDALIADIDYKKALADKTRAEATVSQAEANLLGPVAGVKGASLIKNVGKGVLSLAKKFPASRIAGRILGF